MGAQCEICGKKKTMGYALARRGLAKKKGGIGRHISGRSKRTFKPNLQTVRAEVNGTIKRIRVCAKCLRSGKVKKAVS